jgi:LPXTG-motif cell wall-anchored protein
MKPRRLLSITLAVCLMTALSAAVATAQSDTQTAQSAPIAMDAPGYQDTGGKQVTVHTEGNTDNKKSRQPKPQRKQQPQASPYNPQEIPEGYKDNATPPKAASAPAQAPAPAPAPAPKELPKTGGSSAASLFVLGTGVLLVAGGLLARRLVR